MLRSTGQMVGRTAAGLRQHSKSSFESHREPRPSFLFSPRHVRVCKWGHLFSHRRGLATAGRSPSTGGESRGHSFINWLSPSDSRSGYGKLFLALESRVNLGFGFVLSKTVRVSSEYFGFSCQFSFHQMLHTHLSAGAGTTGQLVADVPSGLSLTPLHETK
jgi:hypothetical protein